MIPRQKNRADIFDRTFVRNILARADFHVVMSTVVQEIMQTGCAKTTKTLPMFTKAREEYFDDGIADDDKTKYFLCTVSLSIWRSFRGKECDPNVLT